MKLYAPKYYKKFKCIADRCEHSCCIGWEIDIDGDTLKKYKNLKDGYGQSIVDSISLDGPPHFKLGECDRCPHLDDSGLCRIISSVGEGYLCDICREHPRFYNYTSVAEVGIGASCPEAARIILSSPDYAESEQVGEVDSTFDGVEFDGRAERGKIYSILGKDYALALEEIYRIYSIDVGDDEKWLEIIGSLEYLDIGHKELFLRYSSACRLDETVYSERFLAYLIYRHCTEAINIDDFRERLSFCLFCERLFSSVARSTDVKSLNDVATLVSVISEEIEYSDDNTFALMSL